MKRPIALLLCAPLAGAFLCAPLQALAPLSQEPAPKEAPPKDEDKEQDKDEEPEEKEKKDPHLKEWPEVEDKRAASLQIKRLLKPNNDEAAKDSAEKLTEMGASIAPLLIKEYKRKRDEDVLERIEGVLDDVLAGPHTRLLAEYFDDKNAGLRRFALYKVAYFPDEGVRKQAEAAYKLASAENSKWEKRDRYLTALCCASAGSKSGWQELVEAAKDHWGKYRDDLSIALPPLRNDATSQEIIDEVGGEERQSKVDCLRLLSLVGTKQAIPYVKPLLDSDDASIRVAAINACRGIVDREPPLGDISVFTAVELAKKWKDRL